jgi:hypothetical protein
MSLMENIDKELRTAENELTLDFGFWTFRLATARNLCTVILDCGLLPAARVRNANPKSRVQTG